MKQVDFSYMVTRYLSHYLPGQCNASPNTILAYRDMFKLLIRFAENERGIIAEKLTVAMIDKMFVEDFLNWLEISKRNSIATRNHRLAGIHAFFRYLQRENPELMFHCQQILNIRVKKAPKPTVNYMGVDTVKQLLAEPDTADKYGFRDAVLLGLLYDTGARVSELTELKPMDLRLQQPAAVSVMGKGRKIRQCPISPTLAENLVDYLNLWGLNTAEKASAPLFLNHKGEKISRAGVTYILKKYTSIVHEIDPSGTPSTVSPHVLRHSKAMHLLEAGVNLVYIRDQLGHANISTTEVYARANPEVKRTALAKAAGTLPEQKKTPSWLADGNLMTFLNSLGK